MSVASRWSFGPGSEVRHLAAGPWLRSVSAAKVARVFPGPTSRKIGSGPDRAWRTVRTASANFTVSRICAAQYSGRVTSLPAQAPVSVVANGIVGGDSDTRDTCVANSSSIGSIIDEWNACDVCSRRETIDAAVSCAATASIADSGPASTPSPGALIAASDTRSSAKRSSVAAGAITASIAPRGNAEINCPRRAIRCSASSSDITPASVAATNSPTLCPIIADGRIPHDCQSVAIA